MRQKLVVPACGERSRIEIKYDPKVFTVVPAMYGILNRPAFGFRRTRGGAMVAVVPTDSPDCEFERKEYFEIIPSSRGGIIHRLATRSIWPLPPSPLCIRFFPPIPAVV